MSHEAVEASLEGCAAWFFRLLPPCNTDTVWHERVRQQCDGMGHSITSSRLGRGELRERCRPHEDDFRRLCSACPCRARAKICLFSSTYVAEQAGSQRRKSERTQTQGLGMTAAVCAGNIARFAAEPADLGWRPRRRPVPRDLLPLPISDALEVNGRAAILIGSEPNATKTHVQSFWYVFQARRTLNSRRGLSQFDQPKVAHPENHAT